jgi:putative FmdB family regulatory protein
MPIYEYECGSCHHRFELKQSYHDKPQASCPQCKNKARRVFHPSPIIFKGSGFYVTDHRSSNPESAKPETKKQETKTPETKKSSDLASDKKETKKSSE